MNEEKQSGRINRQIDYVKGVKSDLDGKKLYDEYREDIENVTPQEAFEIFHLFPYMENAMPKFHGLSIMWALHDVVRDRIKKAIDIAKDSNSSEEQLNKAIADVFFGMLGLKKKEELILFPSASEVLSEDDWHQMYKQSLEYNFPFIEKPDVKINDEETEIFESGRYNLRSL